MTTVNVYLTFKGNCEEAFNFYKSVFGGEFPYVGRFKEMPPMDGCSVPEEDLEKIMHMSLPISAETMIMGSDSSEAFGQVTTIGNNFSISITTDSKEEADRIALEDNALTHRNIYFPQSDVMVPDNKDMLKKVFRRIIDKYQFDYKKIEQ